MRISVASIAVNFAAATFFVKWLGLGHAGLALATSLVAIAGAAALLAILAARLRHRDAPFNLPHLGASTLKIAAAAAVMALVCRVSSHFVRAFFRSGRAPQLVDVAVSIPLGAAVFCAAAYLFRSEELKELWYACYTARRNASRPEFGDPPAGHRSSFGGSGT
jgi:peptidoglycan biosynthesis protein MviN/MurJ (putative lipid II flippase)